MLMLLVLLLLLPYTLPFHLLLFLPRTTAPNLRQIHPHANTPPRHRRRSRKQDQLFRVMLHLRVGNNEAKVIEEEELQLELTQLREGETTDLEGRRKGVSTI